MNHAKHLTLRTGGLLISALALILLVGCQSGKPPAASTTTTPEATPAAATAPAAATVPAATAAPAETPAPAMTNAPALAAGTIRIDAGSADAYTNSAGEVWLADQGFVDGETIERDSDMQIANTQDPTLYRTEHYGMTEFSYNVPNGKYTVKLHFCETYEGITGPGQRVFSFSLGGQEFKDFDVWVKAGGAQHAYIETVDVDVTDGKLDIKFTPNIENPEINAIEIIPAS
jgi:Malectin domain